jgi:hypothetical protein
MPRRLSPIVLSQFADALGPPHGGTEPAEKWQGQVDSLRTLVQRWTGNPPQVVDLSFRDWRHPDKAHQPLLNEIQRDRVELIRSDAITSFGAVEAANG